MKRRLIAAIVLVVCISSGQVRINNGEVAGVVRGQDGRPIANTRVTVRDPERGTSQTAISDAEGMYRVALVPPRTYTVDFSAVGYVVESFANVQVNVGETVRVDATLQFVGAAFKTDVTAAALPIDFVRTHQASAVTSQRIENLPINQRNYLDFALLTPGVSETNTVANAFDFRAQVSPSSGVSFAGSNGRGNMFSIDGIENVTSAGGVRPSLAQTAVQEFQVNRNSYPAEYGGAYGGTLNIVSKSGTNEHHAEVFAYLRQRKIQARNYFDPAKSAYTRVQSGFGAGGPLRKNRLYYFAGFERLDRHESAFVPLLADRRFLSDLTAGQQQIVSALAASGSPILGGIAGLLRGLLTPPLNPGVSLLFQTNSGVFPFRGAGSTGSLRVDANLRESQQLFLRFNIADQNLQNTQFGAQTGWSRGNSTSTLGGTAMGSYTRRLNPQWGSVTRGALSYFGSRMDPNDQFGPAIDIAGFGSFGRDNNTPWRAYDRRFQIQQSFDYSRARHALKFGVDINPWRGSGYVDSAMAGVFTFGEFIPLGLLLGTIDPSLPGNLATVLGPTLAPRLNEPINSLQAYTLGLPVSFLQGFGKGDVGPAWQKHFSAYVEDSYRVNPSLTIDVGLRFQSDATTRFPEQHFFDPRFGFAWSPGGSSNLVVRGGYGLYHSWIDSQIIFLANSFLPPLAVNLLFVPITGLPGVINPQTGLPLTSVDIYQSLQARGILGKRQIRFSDLTPLGIQAGFKFPADGGLDPGYRSPGAQQASIQVERSLGTWVVSAGYDFSKVQHLPRERDHNLYQAGTRPDGSPIFGRLNPLIFTNFVVEGSGNSLYNGFVLQVEKRFRKLWTLNAHYTFSRAIDDVSDYDPNFAPHNPLDWRSDRGLSTFHRKHRFTASGVYETAGWTFSPIVSASSFRPFNILTGYDSLGDGQVATHRPWGLGRNTGIGPGYFNVDGRVSKTLRLRKDWPARVQVIGEVFNALNHTNFEAVNNVVGSTPMSALPRPLKGRRGDPVQPFSFTSAKAPRQFQVGLKVSF